jgi:MoxR-like ATPase
MRFIQVFANIVLADEIPRTPPKNAGRAAAGDAGEGGHGGGQTMKLALPFFVLATQNPIELEGTHPLPEAQLEPFMFNVQVGYPSQAEEERIVASTTSSDVPAMNPTRDCRRARTAGARAPRAGTGHIVRSGARPATRAACALYSAPRRARY